MKKFFDYKKIILATLTLSAFGFFGYYLFFNGSSEHIQVIQKTSVAKKVESKKLNYRDEIPGKIITLKKMTLDCVQDYYDMFSPMVRQGLEFPEKINFSYVAYYVDSLVRKQNQNKLIAYNIWDNKDNKMIGSIQVREKNNYDPGQLGMWMNEKYWGGGRIQEALLLISQEYFRVRKEANEYIAHARLWNDRSWGSLKKFGFKKIADYIEDGEITRHVYEITRSDIEAKAN